MEEMQKKLGNELESLKQAQKDYQKAITIRQQLDAQRNENSVVKEELGLLKSSNTVFKLIGPVLVKQDLEEARQNVDKRIKYITTELERQEKLIEEHDKKMNKHKDNLDKLQTQIQQTQMKAAKA